jgi:hypothetical protein
MKMKNPSTKHFAIVFFPGFAMSNQTTLEVKDRTPDAVSLSKSCFAFRFFDQTEVEFEGETLKGKPKNYSGTYFIDGVVCSVDEAVSTHSFDVANLCTLRPEELLVKTRSGSWQWFDPKKDHIYSTKERELIEQ